jgi:hypothetical protein
MPDWDAAMKYYSSAWLGITYDAAVLLGDHVQQHAPDVYTAWNDTVVMYSKAVDPLVERVIQMSDAPSKYRDVLTAGIKWDLLSCCMEYHYSEIWDCCTDKYTRFFRELSTWYAKGRLPCGWVDGPPPTGMIVVY